MLRITHLQVYRNITLAARFDLHISGKADHEPPLGADRDFAIITRSPANTVPLYVAVVPWHRTAGSPFAPIGAIKKGAAF